MFRTAVCSTHVQPGVQNYCMFNLCSEALYAQAMFRTAVCSSHVQNCCMFKPCSQHVQAMFTICSSHVHCMFKPGFSSSSTGCDQWRPSPAIRHDPALCQHRSVCMSNIIRLFPPPVCPLPPPTSFCLSLSLSLSLCETLHPPPPLLFLSV